MPTVISTLLKSRILNSVLGKMSTTSVINRITIYSGPQPASPEFSPAGSIITTVSGLLMSSPAGGVSILPSPAQASSTASIVAAWGRVQDDSSYALIDTTVTLAGGGGGVIVPTLNAVSGTMFQVSQFSVKLNSSNGSLMLSDALRDAIVSAICVAPSSINACSSASIRIYSGTPPANANIAPTGTLLATFTTAAAGASWGTVAGTAAGLAAALTATAVATGTAGYARIEKGSFVIQGSVGTADSDFVLDNLSITSGNTSTLSGATISI